MHPTSNASLLVLNLQFCLYSGIQNYSALNMKEVTNSSITSGSVRRL